MNAEELSTQIDSDARPAANGWNVRCPAHNDEKASLSVSDGDNGRVLVHCQAGCPQESVIEALRERHLWNGSGPKVQRGETLKNGEQKSNPKNEHTTEQSETVCTLEAYAKHKKLDIGFLKKVGVTDSRRKDSPSLRISYRDAKGDETAVHYRVALTGNDGNRYIWRKGGNPSLYGLWCLEDARRAGYVVLAVGESDCHTLWQRNIPAIGLPGANMWRESRDAAQLEGIGRIYVVIEPGQGGKAVKEWLARSLIKERAWLINLDRFKDPSGLHVASPTGFDKVWRAVMREAVSATAVFDSERNAAREAAHEACHELARNPNLMRLFVEELRTQGTAGEERVAQLLYLCLTSRILDRPISAAVKGPSSVGKSHLVGNVLRFFPASAYYSYTAMSEHALAYGEEPLEHRTIVIYEADGLGENASYLMRSLLSEGCIKYHTLGKKEDGAIKSNILEREGPTNTIVTTTKLHLHPENETRLL